MESKKPLYNEGDGEKYLNLLGLGHLAGKPIPDTNLQARDFLDVCGEEALPALVGFESLSPDDPRYENFKAMLVGRVIRYIAPETEG